MGLPPMGTDGWGRRDIPADVRQRYVAEGWWTDETLGHRLARGLDSHRANTFSVRSRTRPATTTLGDVLDLSRRLASGLHERGIGPGDVLAFQLPNWVEAAATFYAACFLGAVVAPVVHFYGRKEVTHILRQSGARALVTAAAFGPLDYLATLEALRPDVPELETVVVVGDDVTLPAGTLRFDAALGDPLPEPLAADPDAPALVGYTSGTTAEPKGVVHSHRTIGFEVVQLAGMQHPNVPPTLVGAPVGHAIGMLAALLLPLEQGQPIHLIDQWDPGWVLQAMLEDRLLAGTGATFFLTSLLDHPEFTDQHLELMRWVGLGGSAVPAAVGERAEGLGISLVRLYGSTEHPSTTGSRHDDPRHKKLYTDGRPMLGVEVRLADDGEILSRGPDCCIGYTDPALTATTFGADGWYATGDIGVLDDDGYLTITDRKKDVIIRGGENVSAAEVEELLARLPGVAEVAVVAAPDLRLGEHGCAFVRAAPGADPPSLDAMHASLRDAGLARPKWPEDLRLVDDFPRTASGKIQKFVLRDALRREHQ